MAEARFGKDNVHLSVRLMTHGDDDRTIHALTAIEAMANLQAAVHFIFAWAEISGQTYDDTLNAQITGLFQDKLSQYQALSLSTDTLEEPHHEEPVGPISR